MSGGLLVQCQGEESLCEQRSGPVAQGFSLALGERGRGREGGEKREGKGGRGREGEEEKEGKRGRGREEGREM